MVLICFDEKYLNLFNVIVKIRLNKALETGIYGTDEWLRIVNDTGYK